MAPFKILLLVGLFSNYSKLFVNCANILAIFPSAWKSHYLFGRSVLSELAKHGHNVTLVSAYSDLAQENVTEIEIHGIITKWIEMGLSFKCDELREKSTIERLTRMIYAGTANADLILGSREVQSLLKSSQKFDVLVVDLFLSDALLGLSYYYKIPTIVISAGGTNKWLNEMMGNPHSPALNPNSFLPFLENMSLWERIINTLMITFEKLTYNFFHILYQEAIYRRHFEQYTHDLLPPLNDLVHNVSLVLLNSHPVIQYPRAYVPNMIEIGGAHINREKSHLSKAFRIILSEASDGAILISFGANLRTMDLPQEKLNALMSTLQLLKAPVTVILKWEDTITQEIPANVILLPWVPQQDILDHPNLRLFVTTGGLLSIMEAVNSKTPILGIPVLPEQELNVKRLENLGCGLKIDYDNFTHESLLWGINEILSNSKYKQNIEKVSYLFQQNLNHPLDKAIYYIDLILRTNGAVHLRSHASNLGFFKANLLDVLLIIIIGILIILAVPSIIICAILRKSNNYRPEWYFRDENQNKEKKIL